MKTLLISLVVFAALMFCADGRANEGEIFFEAKIRPLLVKRCYSCHSAKTKREGGLLLDRRDGLLTGGDSGPAVVVEKPDESLLMHAVQRRDDVSAMPPDSALPKAEVELLRQWIAMGLPDPRGEPAPPVVAPEDHWAFQPPVRARPEFTSQWARGSLDVLLHQQMAAAGVTPSDEAPIAVQVKRLSYDLTGLPPTKEMLDEVAGARNQDLAYQRLADQLLASPRFGERWARHWLDLARYSDTKGYVFREDRAYKDAYRYRDWVIRSLNEDLPYDQFIVRQIAADRLFPEEPDQLAAMGFLTLGRRFLNNIHDIIDDRIDVVTRGTMGLTVSCARCHDHKYDPIPTQDYYSLYSVFFSSDEPKDGAPLRLVDRPQPRDVKVFLRGNAGSRGEPAPRGFVRVLSGGEPQRFTDGSGRLELAQAIVSRDNPLTARVLVNRVWGRLFGQHFVDTPSDFGVRTAPPAQQAALDHLACQLMGHDWSVKSLVREIVLSSAYRQSSASRDEPQDPENLLFWRMNRRRLDLEAMRDTLLSVCDQLNASSIGGPSVDIVAGKARRRTLYAYIDRQNLPSLFRTFDFAGPDTHNPKRPNTTVPQQALFLMNSDLAIELSERFAARFDDLAMGQRIHAMFLEVYQRPPVPEESELCAAMIRDAQKLASQPADGWLYGHGVTNDDGEVTDFQPLPFFTGVAYQGGDEMPDSKLGWASLRADGGHPGRDRHAIRRWVAPSDMRIRIQGDVEHPVGSGDGVQASIVSSRSGQLASEHVKKARRSLTAEVDVQAGDFVDLVVQAGPTASFDTFRWSATIEILQAKSDAPRDRQSWDSRKDFGPPASRLSPWAQLAQVLLMSNELQFID